MEHIRCSRRHPGAVGDGALRPARVAAQRHVHAGVAPGRSVQPASLVLRHLNPASQPGCRPPLQLCCASLSWVACASRFLPPSSAFALLYLSQCCGALGQPLLLNNVARVAGDWFPAEHRDAAVTVAVLCVAAGRRGGGGRQRRAAACFSGGAAGREAALIPRGLLVLVAFARQAPLAAPPAPPPAQRRRPRRRSVVIGLLAPAIVHEPSQLPHLFVWQARPTQAGKLGARAAGCSDGLCTVRSFGRRCPSGSPSAAPRLCSSPTARTGHLPRRQSCRSAPCPLLVRSLSAPPPRPCSLPACPPRAVVSPLLSAALTPRPGRRSVRSGCSVRIASAQWRQGPCPRTATRCRRRDPCLGSSGQRAA